MVEMYARKGVGNFSHAGKEYAVNEDGVINVPKSAVEAAKSHGYFIPTVVVDPKKPTFEAYTAEEVAAMRRSDLIDYCERYKVSISASIGQKELREKVLAHNVEMASKHPDLIEKKKPVVDEDEDD